MTVTAFSAPAAEPTIIKARLFDAPRELVWKACTGPKHVTRWWGPRGFSNTVHEMNVRPGGAWLIDQRAPDGTVYRFRGTYREVVVPERMIKTFGVEGMHEDKIVIETHTFEEEGGKTKLTTVSRLESIADREAMLAAGMERGAKQSLDRLSELLPKL
jgi:uncharacterized protein YndB with AHSA1/START domain